MDIHKYREDHSQILRSIEQLRQLSQRGVSENAKQISALIISVASHVKLHLAMEDAMLYPALARSGNREVIAMGEDFQKEMEGLSRAFGEFVARWRIAERVAADPEGFRGAANAVFKSLFERIRRENTEFYPAVEKA